MARRNASPYQIIRKDGNKCFVEALNSSFNIGKVHLKFVTYDLSQSKGNRFTNEIDLYLDINLYLRISYDFLNKGQILKDIVEAKKVADTATQQQGKKVWAAQKIIYQGGRSEKTLAASGESRPDGKAEARVLKVFMGDKLPIMFKAEQGAGESDKNGLIIPKYGYTPESYVQLGMTFEDVKEFFLTINEQVDAYFGRKLLDLKYEVRFQTLEYKVDMMKDLLVAMAKQMGVQEAQGLVSQLEQNIESLKPSFDNQNNSNKQDSGRYQGNKGGYGNYNNQSYQNNNRQPQNTQNYQNGYNNGYSNNTQPPAQYQQAPPPSDNFSFDGDTEFFK